MSCSYFCSHCCFSNCGCSHYCWFCSRSSISHCCFLTSDVVVSVFVVVFVLPVVFVVIVLCIIDVALDSL